MKDTITTAESMLLQRVEDGLDEVRKELRQVYDKVGDMRDDITVIKEQSKHMLKLFEHLSTDHEAHKIEMRKKLTDHDNRLKSIEDKQLTWKTYFVALAATVTVACSVAVGVAKIYDTISHIPTFERQEGNKWTGNRQ
jgi:ABC-type multidrug transport system fused ATPase/permease subunit